MNKLEKTVDKRRMIWYYVQVATRERRRQRQQVEFERASKKFLKNLKKVLDKRNEL